MTHRRRLLLLALPVALVLIGGATIIVAIPGTAITRENAVKVEKGMTFAEAQAILGGPPRNDSTGPIEIDPEIERWILPGSSANRKARHPVWDSLSDAENKEWFSEHVWVSVWIDRNDRVAQVMCLAMRPAEESTLDRIRRWLHL